MNRSLVRKLILLTILISAFQIRIPFIHAQSPISSAELITRVTNAYATFSPDGEKIAYMSNADGDFDIYVRYLNERIILKLTDAPDRDGTPIWSPDGSQIAFQSFRDGQSQIYIMNADGSKQRNISNSPAHDEHPFWSSDGKRILFCSDRPMKAIWTFMK